MMTRTLIVLLALVSFIGCSSGRYHSNCPDECRRQYSSPDKQQMCIKFCK